MARTNCRALCVKRQPSASYRAALGRILRLLVFFVRHSHHQSVAERVAIIGAGVSGLTCGIVFAEQGHRTAIFAKETGQQTTSSVAAAVWFPYHVEPAERVIPLALETYQVLLDLARFPESGVSIIESRQFLRTGEIEIPDWAIPLGASVIPSVVKNGVAEEAATWTGRPEAERTGSERIKSLESLSKVVSLFQVPLRTPLSISITSPRVFAKLAAKSKRMSVSKSSKTSIQNSIS